MNYTIDEPCEAIEAQLNVLGDYLDHKFADASDVSYGRYLIKQYDRLESAQKLLTALKGIIDDVLEDEDLRSYKESEATEVRSPQLRKFSVSISEGMIKQNLLTLTEAKKRGLVKEGEYFTITPDSGERFETKLLSAGNRLQERGKIAAFYKTHAVEDGDRVIMEEVKPGHWRLYLDEVYRKALAKALEDVLNL
ncbi:MAG: hypothetical protein ACSHX4_10610 [Opitutaceae bacterium]